MSDLTMPAALEAAGIVKTFGAHRALDEVTLTVRAGEVHGLLGENGSGKSTVIKILSGYHRPDGGRLALGGVAVPLPLTPARSAELGLRFVHQDLGLIPTLTVAENFALAELSAGRLTTLTSERGMGRRATEVLEGFGVHLDPRAVVRTLSGVERAMLAIVRAIDGLGSSTSGTALTRVLVLDEPTVFLPRHDVERLFDLVRGLAQSGCAVLLVSHDLDEIGEITDRVTVLRDGRLAGTAITGSVSRAEMIDMIIGRQLSQGIRSLERTEITAPPVLQVQNLSGRTVNDVSFEVAAGEIVGLTGLAGSGFDEVPYLLYGARPAAAGRLVVKATAQDAVKIKPHRALRLGLVLLPADRRRTAGVTSLTLDDNISQPRLIRFRSWFGLRRRDMRRDTASILERFDVRPRDPNRVFGTLSGGNQQKALLGKWLEVGPDVVLVDEPTQGVDIGAREQIFGLFRSFTEQGRSVVCASTDHEQLAVLTDRTLVFNRGRLVAELRGSDLTKQRLTQASFAAVPSPDTPSNATGGDLHES